MSRIGNAPIEVLDGADVTISGTTVTVKGPKGELVQEIHPSITVKQEEKTLLVERTNEEKQTKAYHGLYRSLINNMVVGVTKGYTIQQELVGVGYRATASGQQLDLMLGYSHPVVLLLPKEVKVSANTEKGKNPIVTLESADKQLVGQVAAKIRSLRKPEPYKGKGIKYVGEQLRRKAGKTAAS